MQHHEFLEAYLKDRQKMVEEALESYLPDEDSSPQELHTAVHYSVFAGGKRLRPILCLAASESCGGDIATAMPSACALELIHTYSLIHDDLPAMDNDDFRRGKPTSHKVFGDAIAILAGDALLTEAFVLLSGRDHPRIPSERRLAVISEIATAAGLAGMVGGQALDMNAIKITPDFDGLEEIHRRKTGALICASVKAGAILAGADAERLQALADYAGHIGLAFQISDDILNVEGDAAVMGKKTGSDAALGKITYPSLLGVEEARERLFDHVEAAVACLTGFDSRALPLRLIARYIRERKS